MIFVFVGGRYYGLISKQNVSKIVRKRDSLPVLFIVLGSVLGGSFIRFFFIGVILSFSTRCGRGRACFVVVGKIGAYKRPILMDCK